MAMNKSRLAAAATITPTGHRRIAEDLRHHLVDGRDGASVDSSDLAILECRPRGAR